MRSFIRGLGWAWVMLMGLQALFLVGRGIVGAVETGYISLGLKGASEFAVIAGMVSPGVLMVLMTRRRD